MTIFQKTTLRLSTDEFFWFQFILIPVFSLLRFLQILLVICTFSFVCLFAGILTGVCCKCSFVIGNVSLCNMVPLLYFYFLSFYSSLAFVSAALCFVKLRCASLNSVSFRFISFRYVALFGCFVVGLGVTGPPTDHPIVCIYTDDIYLHHFFHLVWNPFSL